VKKTRRLRFTSTGWLCLTAAAFFVVLGVVQVRDLYLLDHRGEVVTGKVVDLTQGKHPTLKVEYVTRAGQAVVEDTQNFRDVWAGQSVDVVYDPKNPHRMQTANYGFAYWQPSLLFIGTAFFAAIALLCERDR
jgi:hypothetical protein